MTNPGFNSDIHRVLVTKAFGDHEEIPDCEIKFACMDYNIVIQNKRMSGCVATIVNKAGEIVDVLKPTDIEDSVIDVLVAARDYVLKRTLRKRDREILHLKNEIQTITGKKEQ